jgi:O-antigen/teichoic acid export membrane protein
VVERDPGSAAARVDLAIHLIWLLGLPMAGGLIVLAPPLTRMLYGSSQASGALEVLALGSSILAVQQVVGSSLQASGHGWMTVRNLGIAASVKFVLTWRLTALMGIEGAALSTVLASFTAVWLNWRDWQRLVRPAHSPWMTMLWPLAGTVVMAMGVQTWTVIASRALGLSGLAWPTLSAIAVGAAIYFVLMAAAGELNVLKSLREWDKSRYSLVCQG